MKQILVKTAVLVLLFMVSFLKGEAQSVFGERWYRGGFSHGTMSVSPNGDVVAMSSDSVRLHDAYTGKILKTLSQRYGEPLWSPDGKFLLLISSEVTFLDTATGAVLKELPYLSTYNFDYKTKFGYFSPGGKYLILDTNIVLETEHWTKVDFEISAHEHFTLLPGDTTALVMPHQDTLPIRLVRFPSKEILKIYPEPYINDIRGNIAVNSTGTVFALNALNGDSVLLVNIASGNVVNKITHEYRIDTRPVADIRFSPDDKSILLGNNTLWDIENDSLIGFGLGQFYRYSRTAISPDWSRFYGNREGSIQYLCQGEPMPKRTTASFGIRRDGQVLWRTPDAHGAPVMSIVFNTNQTLTTTDGDGQEITWNSEGQIIHRLQVSLPLQKIDKSEEFSPSGRYSFKESKLWDVAADTVIKTFHSSSYSPPESYMPYSWTWMPDERYFLLSVKVPRGGYSVETYTSLRVVDVNDGKVIDSLYLSCQATVIRTTPDGNSFALATQEYGIMWGKLNLPTTSIENINEREFSLSFHPNPLKESSTISYSLPNDDVVKITLYNVLGNEIEVLHDGFKSAGNYTLPFKNENLPNGTYFLKMSAGGQTLTKSVSIVR